MSHFIVGRAVFNPAIGNSEGQKLLTEAARKYALVVRFPSGDSGQLQIDILTSAGLVESETDVLFELVGPSGTADELISPYVLINQWPQSTKGNLDGISNLTKELLLGPAVDEISFVFSEGYDTHYETCDVTCNVFTEILLNKFDNSGEVPSLAVVIRS